ncbi:fimbrial protein [Citrobacter amalonaticus]|uniref:fimbrial protein n=1 Tax=Citrobacter amalonaticus TaxID=35703 RepID=UPI00300C8F80
MSKLIYAVLTYLITVTAFAAQGTSANINPSSEFDPALSGRVNINGSILSSACDIDTGDSYQEITMPKETRGHIKRAGTGEPQDFSIQLTNCSLDSPDESAGWQYLNIIFDGDDDEGFFRVSGNAGGVALQLQDSHGEIIHPGKSVPWRQTSVADNRLNYQFRLRNTMRSLVVGDYSAIIRYRIEYF